MAFVLQGGLGQRAVTDPIDRHADPRGLPQLLRKVVSHAVSSDVPDAIRRSRPSA